MKKSAEALAETEERLYRKGKECGRSQKFLDYLWRVQIEMSKSYSFNLIHSHEYSTECLQELNLYWRYPKIYWNTATIIVRAGTEDKRENNNISIDYGKISKSIYNAKENNIIIAPPSINTSEETFAPNESANSILVGLACISSVNTQISTQIINNRPYTSFADFYNRNTYTGSLVTPSIIIMLIKAGCFDEFNPDRVAILKEFSELSTPKKQELTLSNVPLALKIGVKFPNSLIAPYNFKKYVCSKEYYYGPHPNFKSKKIYWMDDKALEFFNKYCRSRLEENKDWFVDGDKTLIVDSSLDKLFKKSTEKLKEYINEGTCIAQYNLRLQEAKYNELTRGNEDTNHWSMEAVSYYSDKHELAGVNFPKYNIAQFSSLPEEPIFEIRNMRGRTWPQYEIYAICGTVLARNDNNHILTILTPENDVVNIKFNQETFAFYKSQISEDIGGKSVIRDKPWFKRGELLIVCGYRRGANEFVAKKYKSSVYSHLVYRIEAVNGNDIEVRGTRWGYKEEE